MMSFHFVSNSVLSAASASLLPARIARSALIPLHELLADRGAVLRFQHSEAREHRRGVLL
jgi:hypothetical protein